MFDGRFRTNIEQAIKPVGANLRKTGISADHLTVLGIVMATAAALTIGAGYLRAGLLLLILAGVPDLLDGAVAKASGTTSTRGAFFDSVSDRLSDALLFGGVAWYLQTNNGGRIALLPYAVFAAAALVSYIRAKADALGYDARGGLMERAERFILLGIGLLFSEMLIGVLWVMLVATSGTVVYRFVKVWRQADRPPAPARPAARTRRRRTGTTRSMADRRVAWRERMRSRRP
ncbi:MAG: CDP-alcohol phosphatidyltransferase family protein [Gammaproteobacteria bacterium]|jgi:CDP-diacylglycerol--glycerol-3-phosphate 3-phosphatidyltransferase|nr:CDP-alcohol phosphatidyltransferase family protein [Gammaproteobacteria bacterium]